MPRGPPAKFFISESYSSQSDATGESWATPSLRLAGSGSGNGAPARTAVGTATSPTDHSYGTAPAAADGSSGHDIAARPPASGAVAVKRSADGLFCKVEVAPVVSPPSSLLSEQIRRSPPVDPNRPPLVPAGVPMMPPQLRRSSAPMTFHDTANGSGGGSTTLAVPPTQDRRARRLGAGPATIPGGRPVDDRGPPPLLEGTESVRLNLMHERATVTYLNRQPALTTAPGGADAPEPTPAVFSYRSKVTGW